MTIPAPVRGAIAHFSYLWADEAEQGTTEGRKDRPCVILAVLESNRVLLAPITHSSPADPEAVLAIPPSLKAALGLDDAPAWIIATELNVSDWPGFDLRPVPGRAGVYYHAKMPPGLFAALQQRFSTIRRAGKLRIVSRA